MFPNIRPNRNVAREDKPHSEENKNLPLNKLGGPFEEWTRSQIEKTKNEIDQVFEDKKYNVRRIDELCRMIQRRRQHLDILEQRINHIDKAIVDCKTEIATLLRLNLQNVGHYVEIERYKEQKLHQNKANTLLQIKQQERNIDRLHQDQRQYTKNNEHLSEDNKSLMTYLRKQQQAIRRGPHFQKLK